MTHMSEKRPIYRDTEHERMFESSYMNLEETHARAAEALAAAEVKPELFAGLYDDNVIQRDAREVKRWESFESHGKMYADILEAVVCEHGELSDWFGSKSQVIKTARFDDYINKIDMVIETEDETSGFSHLALGVDVTFGSKDLHKKFDGIRSKIDDGSLGEVKYFHSDRQHFTGRKRMVPQVVVGVEIERVKELGLLWMNRRNKELALHPVQTTILEEAALQLEAFAEYAERTGKTELVTIFRKELQKIRELLAEKKEAGIASMKDDKVFAEIKRNLASFGHTGATE